MKYLTSALTVRSASHRNYVYALSPKQTVSTTATGISRTYEGDI